MNKREIFNKITSFIISGKYETNVKITEKEDFICYSFGRGKEALDEIRAIIKEHGYKDKAYEEWNKKRSILSVNRFCILYDKKRDKISVKYLESGWNYAKNKGRFYPINKAKRIFCYSGKHIYIQNNRFIKIKHMKSTEDFTCTYASYMLEAILNRPKDAEPICLNIPMRHYIGAKTNKEALNKYFNIDTVYKIPEGFNYEEVQIYRDLWASNHAHPGEVNCHLKAQKALECFLELHEINKTMRRKISVNIKTNTFTPEQLGLYKLIDKGKN